MVTVASYHVRVDERIYETACCCDYNTLPPRQSCRKRRCRPLESSDAVLLSLDARESFNAPSFCFVPFPNHLVWLR